MDLYPPAIIVFGVLLGWDPAILHFFEDSDNYVLYTGFYNCIICLLLQESLFYQYIDAKKAIIFLPSLLQLFSVCRVPSCGSAVDQDNINIKTSGAMVSVRCLCNSGHQTDWDSGPMLGTGTSAVAVINILLSTYCLITGLHLQQVLPTLVITCMYVWYIYRFWISFNTSVFGASEKASFITSRKKLSRKSFGHNGSFSRYFHKFHFKQLLYFYFYRSNAWIE